MRFGPFKRICNWGPLTALAITLIIILTTIYCSNQRLKISRYPISNYTFMTFIFITLSGLMLHHFINSIYKGPGYLPLNWTPQNKEDCRFLEYCSVCQGYKAPRSHHCRICHYNHGYFTAFLASCVAGCSVGSYIMMEWLKAVRDVSPTTFHPPSLFPMIVIFSAGLSTGIAIAVGVLLHYQLKCIIQNQTGIESLILENAAYRRSSADEQFVNPYSMGCLFNIKQVFSWNCTPPGDGIFWPVIDGCDQYTLTREQLQEKRERSQRYRVVARASGSWVPINYGLMVLCSSQCTDESRIKLDVGDTVIVTQWRKYWLFGEKESTEGTDVAKRGWFPRPCAIPVSETDQESQNLQSPSASA